MIHIAGQVAWDADSNVVGLGDAEAQMEYCIDNIRAILGAVGGRLDDIVSLTIYFLDRADLPAIQRVRARHFKVGTAPVELVPIAVVLHARIRRPA